MICELTRHSQTTAANCLNQSMKTFIILFAAILTLTECTYPDRHAKATLPVNISESHIPKTGQVNQDVEIGLKLQASNGCWTNLKIVMTKIDDFHFLFKGTGSFESNGICPTVMVYKDTTINFKPGLKGKYIFQVRESPLTTKLDTLNIN